MMAADGNPNVLMIGTGEYTTGFVHNDASKSDKGAGGKVKLEFWWDETCDQYLFKFFILKWWHSHCLI